jgi:hypothetical protein
MSEILGMTRHDMAAMDQAYTELHTAQRRAARRKR